MFPDFDPLFRNPHLATIAGNFWKRPVPRGPGHGFRRLYQVNLETTISGIEQRPSHAPIGQIIFLHGLEGSANAGYLQSFSTLALTLNFVVHRLNFRTCGGTEALCSTMYHSGLSSDTKFIINQIKQQSPIPTFLVGFSLGGNVALKLTGELGADCPLEGTISISAPIQLAACVHAIDKASNRIYAHRFIDRLKNRITRKAILSPGSYRSEFLKTVHTIWQFDDRFTAPLFGFGNAANYYATQSAINYVGQIRTPTLLIAAKDDPLVPFEIYNHPSIHENSALELISPKHGGHIGFLSKRQPRFWVDTVAMDWIQTLARPYASSSNSTT